MYHFSAGQITLALFSLAIFFSYALQFYVVMEILGPNLLKRYVPDRWYNLADYSLRFVLNVFTCKTSLIIYPSYNKQ